MTEEQIKSYMDKLDISREEAIQLIEDDEEDFIGEEGEVMQTKAKSLKRYEKAEASSKTRKPRERKVDEEKLALLGFLEEGLLGGGIAADRENEVRLHFIYNDTNYSVTLTKHRKAKV